MSNQFSQEIHEHLEVLCEKYKVKRGILIFEEADNQSNETKYRTIIFEPNVTSFHADTFAKMFLKCLQVSKSFQKIIDKVSMFSFAELLRDMEVEHDLNCPNHKDKVKH